MKIAWCRLRFSLQIRSIAMASCSQTIHVVRHGERLDYVDATWRKANKERVYDSPLSEEGKRQATEFGKQLKRQNQVSVNSHMTYYH
jgi:bisphosphoglycerate-dependent phosphoglycerate mutase